MSQTQHISKNNTKIIPTPEGVRIILHNTVIFERRGTFVTLCTGGWETVTTQTRMNQISNEMGLGYYVSRKKNAGFSVVYGDKVIQFKDGKASFRLKEVKND